MSKRIKKEIDYEEKEVSENFLEIPQDTSDWEERHVNFFKVKFESFNDNLSLSKLDSNYKELILDGWNKDEIEHKDFSPLNTIQRSIVKILRNILIMQKTSANKEVEVNAFINSLFNKLGFNDDPYLMYAGYKYSVIIKKKEYKSKPDFVILKDNILTIIIEDKHKHYAGILNSWGEYQVIGEIIICAYHTISSKNIVKPVVIYAVKVVGTLFTFYKTELSAEYMVQIYNSKPKDNLIVKRYPPQGRFDNINALDFCSSGDRLEILKMLKSLQGAG
ncbi:hypothetical protein CONCODRAFT_166872 [Conidiobolus coronatus NRRL 28638]|uniref:Uncharacterized protein n=1 Tax=Conidiobolus coronatus (strain ATCC 28846 / CBS 209.66 / NRRL 28638) TaxID=796925 RepID=A0A137NZ13_CONC2|nr:hypothetical protein CONCODRAFT_166872 [Conidiobolus coronatus NRRL 28638]|eukprot:KXN68046.1 hypothetical protein CONCODRAFT_166872 [Conidiobolus coronatus NRRL 28638]